MIVGTAIASLESSPIQPRGIKGADIQLFGKWICKICSTKGENKGCCGNTTTHLKEFKIRCEDCDTLYAFYAKGSHLGVENRSVERPIKVIRTASFTFTGLAMDKKWMWK